MGTCTEGTCLSPQTVEGSLLLPQTGLGLSPPQMSPPSDPGPVSFLKWEQDYNFPLQINDRTNCSLWQKPRPAFPQTRSGDVPANAASAQGTDLVGEAEALGELAHLAQGCQVLVQAADGLLDGLPIGGLRCPWRGQRKAMDKVRLGQTHFPYCTAFSRTWGGSGKWRASRPKLSETRLTGTGSFQKNQVWGEGPGPGSEPSGTERPTLGELTRALRG